MAPVRNLKRKLPLSQVAADNDLSLTEPQLNYVLNIVCAMILAHRGRVYENEWTSVSDDMKCGRDTCRMRVERISNAWNGDKIARMKNTLRGSRFDRALATEFAKYSNQARPAPGTALAMGDAVPAWISAFFRGSSDNIATTFDGIPSPPAKAATKLKKPHNATKSVTVVKVVKASKKGNMVKAGKMRKTRKMIAHSTPMPPLQATPLVPTLETSSPHSMFEEFTPAISPMEISPQVALLPTPPLTTPEEAPGKLPQHFIFAEFEADSEVIAAAKILAALAAATVH
ncbi:uncharacterized protein V1518DRAFT_409389 [Limtongia smithiae]|uniref:uncharacterized protein n=1 Tax=Limtongia smithiae TaxID=1125753 RepID=UPI0034CF610A